MKTPNPVAIHLDLAAVRPGLFPPRPRRLATGPAPLAFTLLAWVLLWAWVVLGVAAPLSRPGAPEPARAVHDASLRA